MLEFAVGVLTVPLHPQTTWGQFRALDIHHAGSGELIMTSASLVRSPTFIRKLTSIFPVMKMTYGSQRTVSREAAGS